MTRDLRWLVGGTAAITMLLVGAIGVVIRLAVLRRLQRFETAAGRSPAEISPKGAGGRHGHHLLAGARNSTPWPIP